jgi:hypothetical protein
MFSSQHDRPPFIMMQSASSLNKRKSTRLRTGRFNVSKRHASNVKWDADVPRCGKRLGVLWPQAAVLGLGENDVCCTICYLYMWEPSCS